MTDHLILNPSEFERALADVNHWQEMKRRQGRALLRAHDAALRAQVGGEQTTTTVSVCSRKNLSNEK